MTSRNPWEEAYRETIEHGRERAGDPPTPEEILAWSRGELPESEAERMRERLAWFPDLAVALSEDEQAADDEAPLLTRDEIESDWELIRQRLNEDPQPHAAVIANPWRQWSTVVPILTALLFAGLFAHSLMTIQALRKENEKPMANVERVEVYATVPRGRASARPILLQPSTRYVVLVLHVAEDVKAESVRARMSDLEADPPAVVWSAHVTRGSDGSFAVAIPRTFFTSRSYEIELIADTGDLVATYTIWISGFRRPS